MKIKNLDAYDQGVMVNHDTVKQEIEMKRTSENTTRTEAREDVTVLGVASVATQGATNAPQESLGIPVGASISDD